MAKMKWPNGVVIRIDGGIVEGPPGPELFAVHTALYELERRMLYHPDLDTEVAEAVRDAHEGVTIEAQKDSGGPEDAVY